MLFGNVLHWLLWGPALMLSGSGGGAASAAQQAQTEAETQFYNQLEQEMQAQYGSQQAILNSLRSIYQPIVNQGIGQYGLGAGEDAALRTQATDSTAQAYQQAAQALGAREAATNETGLPSGANAQLQAGLASNAAQANAQAQLGITQQGYQQGYQNFLNATNVLSGVAGMMNPLGYAGATNSAGGVANTGINNWQQDTSTNWAAILGGIGAIAAAPFTGGASLAALGALGPLSGMGGALDGDTSLGVPGYSMDGIPG